MDRLRAPEKESAFSLDSHVPSGGLVRDGQLLMDFHSFPLRIKEVPDKPREVILELGFADGIYNLWGYDEITWFAHQSAA